jgi:acetyl-CoA carboxylase biotin carboxyl carrier protein
MWDPFKSPEGGMEIQKITELIDLVSRSDLTELHLTEGDSSLRLSRLLPAGNTTRVEATPASTLVPETANRADEKPVEAAAAAPIDAETKSSARRVFCSPMVGIFYRAGSPGDTPFVDVGQQVKSGQTLGVVEAMKMLTELEADGDGRIVEIHVENGSFVEFGQPLFSFE